MKNSGIFLLIIAMALFLLIPAETALASSQVFGVIVVRDTNNPDMEPGVNKLIDYLKAIRSYNKISKSDLPIRIFDMADTREAKFCTDFLKVDKSRLPYMTVGLISRKDGSIIGTWDLTTYQIPCIKDPLEAAEKTMDRVSARNAYSRFICPLPTALTIKSEPLDAKIFINDKLRGTTNKPKIYAKPGHYKVVLKKDSFLDYTEEFDLDYGEWKKIIVKLEPPLGNFNLYTSPLNAKVFIDGLDMGFSPVKLIDFPAGYHDFEVRFDNFPPRKLQIWVKGGTTTTKTITPLPNRIKVDVQGADENYLRVRIENFLTKDKDFVIVEDLSQADVGLFYGAWPDGEDEDGVRGELRIYDPTDNRVIFSISYNVPCGEGKCSQKAMDIFENKLVQQFYPKLEEYFLKKAE